MHTIGFPPVGAFGFVIALVLIGSLFQFLKIRSNNETIPALAQSGQPIDPQLLIHLGREREASQGGLLLAGFITLAVAGGLFVFGHQIGMATGDEEVGPIFRALAVIAGTIGAALMVAGAASMILDKKRNGEG